MYPSGIYFIELAL